MADSRLLPPPFTATRGTATRRWKAPVALLLAVVLLAKAAFPWLDRTARAKGFLLALANAEPGDDIAEEVVTLAVPALPGGTSPSTQTRGRWFLPKQVRGRGIVLVHGVHYLGLDEPRLLHLARAIARAGYPVFAPEVKELTGYRIEPSALATIAAATATLQARTGDEQVGIFGISFGGGLSVLAAETPGIREKISFVLAVGGHGDLDRVSHFFLGEGAFFSSNAPFQGHPHEYGAMVLAYRCADRLFGPDESKTAASAMLHWLREEQSEAHREAATLKPESRDRLEALFAGNFAREKGTLSAELAGADAIAWGTSPSRHIEGLRATIFLLHGAGDNVVPPTETERLAHEIPQGLLGDALVTGLVRHAEMADEPDLGDRVRLLAFMTRVLAAADR
jgi:acetyl esterase/lipase